MVPCDKVRHASNISKGVRNKDLIFVSFSLKKIQCLRTTVNEDHNQFFLSKITLHGILTLDKFQHSSS